MQGNKPPQGWTYVLKIGAAPAALATATIPQSSTYIDSLSMTQATTPNASTAPSREAPPTQYVDERYLAASLAAVEARTETKFAQLLGKMDVMVEKLTTLGTELGEVKQAVSDIDGKTNNTRIIIVTTAIGTVVGIVGLLYAIIGYGNQVADSVTSAYATGITIGQHDANKPTGSAPERKN